MLREVPGSTDLVGSRVVPLRIVAPPSLISAIMASAPPAAVREPTAAQVAGFGCLADVFEWSRVKGLLACPGSRAGSLIRLIARDEWDTAEIEDIANVAPDDFESMLENWLYCSYDGNTELDDTDFAGLLDEAPGPMLLGAARAMHHACRIKCKLAWTREDTDAYDYYMVSKMPGSGSMQQAPIILHAPVAPVSQMVNVLNLLDYSKNKEVPIISDDLFYKGIENWRRIVGHGL